MRAIGLAITECRLIGQGTSSYPPSLTASRYEQATADGLEVSAIGAAMPVRFREWLRGRVEATHSLGALESNGVVRFEDRGAKLALQTIETLDVQRMLATPGSIWAENSLNALRALCLVTYHDARVFEAYMRNMDAHKVVSITPAPLACSRLDLSRGVWGDD